MAQQDLLFARDLGYLDKFLTALATHADTLPEPRASELRRLVAAEVGHWEAIKALLGGKVPGSAPAAAPDPGPAVPQAPRGLTVGSLMKRV